MKAISQRREPPARLVLCAPSMGPGFFEGDWGPRLGTGDHRIYFRHGVPLEILVAMPAAAKNLPKILAQHPRPLLKRSSLEISCLEGPSIHMQWYKVLKTMDPLGL